MIRSLIKLGLVLVVGILVYNFYFGTETEKESSRRVFNEVKEVGVAVRDLIRSEKDKFDEGKYDDALDKIENAFGNLRQKARDLEDSDLLDRLAKLEDKRQELETEYRKKMDETPTEFNEKGEEVYDLTNSEKREMKRELDELLRDTEDVVNELERKAQ
ncbi:MAG: hypothetical protein AB8G22_08935 [Saprospiraceae bacterium]